MKHFDIVVIGTGPAGQKGAIQAAKLGKRVAIIEKTQVLGGAQINTGTIPSKALREAALHLTGASKRGLFGESYRVKQDITIADLVSVSQQVIRHEWELIRDQFDRNGIELIWGTAHFEGPNLLQVQRPDSSEMITADKFLVCVGTRPARPEHIPFDGETVFTSDSLLTLHRLPKTMIVVGGGVIGVEYACIMATLGVRVTLVEGRNQVLGFLDKQIGEAFQYFMRQSGITLRMGEKVEAITTIDADDLQHPNHVGDPLSRTRAAVGQAHAKARGSGDSHTDPDAATAVAEPAVCPPDAKRNGESEHSPGDAPRKPDRTLVQARLESGKKLRAETLLYAVGRQGVCGALGLDNVGIEFDDRERLTVSDHYQTSVDHVYAAGDVIGFPALASTSMEQGRRAVCHAFGCPVGNYNTDLFPFGIYAVPEISMVGKTEEQLTEEGIPYEAGMASYKEIARGQLLGDDTGMLKLLIHQETHKLLGVHAIGTGATELIHIGQAVMAYDGTADFFINNVFNFPTLAEAYKVAAYNGMNKLAHI
jgi:NAD(P) transhydrogenase